MRVAGYEITQDKIDNALAHLSELSCGFVAKDLERALLREGVPAEHCMRGSDRIIQRYRRAGHITFSGCRWYFI